MWGLSKDNRLRSIKTFICSATTHLMKGGTYSHQGQAHRGQEELQDRTDKPNSQVGPEVWHNHIFRSDKILIPVLLQPFPQFSCLTVNWKSWPEPLKRNIWYYQKSQIKKKQTMSAKDQKFYLHWWLPQHLVFLPSAPSDNWKQLKNIWKHLAIEDISNLCLIGS